MGERHQLFVIARLGKYYRCLAAAHHQWLVDRSVLSTCLRLIQIFNNQKNQVAIAQEIKSAERFFTNPPSADRSQLDDWTALDSESPIHFPFIATCLLVGTSYDFNSGWVHLAHNEPYGMGFDSGDNNTGITVLDISSPGHTRYCFVDLDSPSSGALSPTAYAKLSNFRAQKAMLRLFEDHELVENNALSATWPYGDWPEDTTQSSPPSTGRKPRSSLRNLAMSELVHAILNADSLDPASLGNVRAIPDFREILRQQLLQHKTLVGTGTTSAELLSIVYEGETFVDLSDFENLTAAVLTELLSRKTMEKMSALNLSGTQASSAPEDLARALEPMANLKELYLLESPGRRNDIVYVENHLKFLASVSLSSLDRIFMSSLFSTALRTEPWMAFGINKQSTSNTVVQLLLAREMTATPSTPLYVHLFLQDALLSPTRCVNGLFEFVGGFVGGTGCMPLNTSRVLAALAAHSFSLGSSVLGRTDTAEIGLLPAELYKIARVQHHRPFSDQLYCQMRDLTPDAWTVVLQLHGDGDDTFDRMGVAVKVQYAFVRARKPISALCTDKDPPEVDPSDVDVLDMVSFLRDSGIQATNQDLRPNLWKLEERIAFAECRDPDHDPAGQSSVFSFMGVQNACRLLTQLAIQNMSNAIKRKELLARGWSQD